MRRSFDGLAAIAQNVLSLPVAESLFVAQTQAPAQAENPGNLICEHRRRTRRCDDEVNDSGLRFDDTVPQTIVDVPAPELTGEQAEQYQIIGFKDSARLAQLRSIFRVLIYRRPIVRHKGEQSVSVPAVPEAALEGCYAGRITQRMRCILSRQAANWPPEINSRFHLPPCPVHRIHFCHEAFEMASF